jgi:hypothetical protein
MAQGDYRIILPQVMKKLREVAAPTAYRNTAARAAHEIVDDTPVETGRARANWFVQDGVEQSPITDDVDPSGSDAKSRATSDAENLRLGGQACISNALPYIETLENGNSKQAPAGMLAAAKQKVPRIFEQEMKRALK